ncbi:Schizosaccharomyces specific protein [Schizosaccharomyces osmophilus]|uniref:Schizosaccharomyces specific protein n=1 Tax=Schizosaccharomyces osmophilus TaxID=2545709 RepID=A0AAF0AUV9_9SCHI|nr:Schizosaccharomyces specific protein [Schizosaccharomyces osmophilus]WBW72002.1 Schizosaccharomyces specific protein [Schizosaccharomyces osmophilus]
MKLAGYIILSFITLASALPSIPYLNKRLAESQNVTLYNSTNTETVPTVPVVLDVVLLNGTSWISTRERFWAVESGGDEFAITDSLHSLRSIDNVLWSPILDNIEHPRLLVLDAIASKSLSTVASDVSGISAYWSETGSNSNATISGSFYPTNVTTNSSMAWNTTSNQTNTSSSASTEVNSLILSSFGLTESFVNHSSSRLVVVGAAKPALTNVSVLDSSETPIYQKITEQSTSHIRREIPEIDAKVIDVFGYNFYFLALSSSISFLKSFAFCNQTSAFSLFQDIASCGLSGQLSSSSCLDGSYYSLFGPTGYFATQFGSSADVVVVQSETNCNATISAAASNTTYVNVNSYVDLAPTLLTNSTYNANYTNSSIPPIPYTITNTTNTNTTDFNSSNSSGVGPLAYYGSGLLNISDYLNTKGDGHVILKGSSGTILGDFYILNYTSVALGDYLIPLWW